MIAHDTAQGLISRASDDPLVQPPIEHAGPALDWYEARQASGVERPDELASGDTHYVHRGYDVSEAHPFRDASFDIWAPARRCSRASLRLRCPP